MDYMQKHNRQKEEKLETRPDCSANHGERLWNDDDPIQQIIGALMKVRRSRKLTQRELADMTGITQPDISRLENGRANPSVKTLKNIADGLGMKLRIDFVPFSREKN